MNWFIVADWVRSKTCDERRNYGSCSCRSKSNGKLNPCQKAAKIQQACEVLANNEPANVDEVLTWAKRHTCYASQHGQSCNHRGCIYGESVIDWIIQTQRKQAA